MTTETTEVSQTTETQAPTLRDALESAYETHIEPGAEKQAESVETTPESGRARGEDGRFVKGETKAEVKPEVNPEVKAEVKTAAPIEKPEKFGIKRPDSWKKELWGIWDKVDAGEALTREEQKQFLEYSSQRESQFQQGVSTYKKEWDNAKPLIDALAPYQPFFQSANLKPEQYIAAIAQSEQAFRFGNDQQKLATLAQWIKDYNIPIHQMFVRGEDGQIYYNQQYQAQAQQAPAQQGLSRQEVAQMFQQYQLQGHVQQFSQAKDASGNLLHPHFEEMRQTMDGLLKSGVVQDLDTAYSYAKQAPQHRHLYEAEQTAKREADEKARKAEEAAKAERARGNTVSTRTSSPTGPVKGNGKASIREALEASYDQHIGGRI